MSDAVSDMLKVSKEGTKCCGVSKVSNFVRD